jgi:hypothetical protein
MYTLWHTFIFFITFLNMTVNCKLLKHLETSSSKKKKNTQYRVTHTN